MVRFIATFLLAGIALAAYSQATVKVKERDGLVYSVFFHADYDYDVTIRLVDKRGQTLITDKLYSAGFEKPYNLRNLPEGSYRFQVKYSKEKFEHTIQIGAREQEILSKVRVAKEKTKKVKIKDPIVILESAEDVKIQVKDPEIEALGVFFYIDNTDEFEYFYWEPNELREQSYKLSIFDATDLRIEVVEDGKVLAQKQIAKN